MIIPSHRDAHRRQIARRGVYITFRRITGAAPNAVTIEKQVKAVVSTLLPDQLSAQRTGYSAGSMGGLTQNARRIIVMAEDLANAGFPVPPRENDTIILDVGNRLNVTAVDMETRAVAGAIELLASGV